VGTFHQGRGELHGITVVVETAADEVLVGRFDREEPRGILLLDVDVHRPGDERSRADFLARAARFGVWKRHDAVLVPQEQVTAIRRLAELPDA
jgi:hypothetical protein